MSKKQPTKAAKRVAVPAPVAGPDHEHTRSCDDVRPAAAPPLMPAGPADDPAVVLPHDPPLVEVLASQLRACQQQLEHMTAQWHESQAQLYIATKDARQQRQDQEHQAMLQRLEASAPEGMTWNQEAGRYVAKVPQ